MRIRTALFAVVLLQPMCGAVAPWPTDRWTQSTPEQQGMDSALLQAGSDYVAAQCPNRYSFLVIRNGYLVWEQYFHGMSRDRFADVMSISKSVLSMLVGQAVEQGYIPSLDQHMADYYPEYFSPATDPRKRQITLRHMLTMTAGFQWDEVASGPGFVSSNDWYKYILDLPLVAAPGEVFNYNTGLSHLLAGILSRATGRTPLAFGYDNLFGPLGIQNFRWETDPRGNYVGGFRMHFSSRDLAKFGYLALRKGYWEDRQLVPRTWIEDSTFPYISYASPTTIGDYAWHWWARRDWSYQMFMAAGWGGQYIFVVPGLDLVVVSTSDTLADGVERSMQAFNLLEQYVIPSISRTPLSPKIDAVVNAASFNGPLAPGTWATMRGRNLSGTTRSWTQDDLIGGNLPVQLDGVAITVGSRPAYVAYISPDQINFLVPAQLAPGDAAVVVTSAPGRSASSTLTLAPASPALFAAAQHADGTRITSIAPATPGEVIVLYGTGFGGPAGELANEDIALASLPQVRVAGTPATVEFAAIPQGAASVVQINVRLPGSVPGGDVPVQVTFNNVEAPPLTLAVESSRDR